MKVAIGCDHGGLHLKASVKELLNALGHEVEDFGCHTADSCDYPDIAVPVANAVVSGQADRGILICGTGIGIGIATGKATEAVARQPEAEGKISKLLLLGCALAEATAIYGFVIAILVIMFLK